MNTQKKRILVVDDDPKFTRLLRLNLELIGEYEVQEENHATQAISAAKEFQPDLILLDVLMPGVDGGSLANQFHQSRELKHIPIVFLTAAVTWQEVHARAGLVGGLPFMAKPVDLPELTKCLKMILGGPAQHGSGGGADFPTLGPAHP